MRILADECVSGQLVAALRRDKHDVLWMKEIRPGEPDAEVLARSHSDSRILLTEDQGFGQLAIRLNEPTYGVVIVAMPDLMAGEVARIVCRVLGGLGERVVGQLTIIEAGRVRQRSLLHTEQH